MQMKGACRRVRDVVAGVALFADFCTDPDQILRTVTALFCLASFSAPQRTKSLLFSALHAVPRRARARESRMAGMNISREARVVPLRELAAVVAGYSPRPDERKRSGKYLLLGGRNIKDGRLVRTVKDSYIDDVPKNSFQRAIAQAGDVIVSTLFDTRKLYIYRSDDPPAVVNSSCAIVR